VGGAVSLYVPYGGLLNVGLESNTFSNNSAGTIDGGAVFAYGPVDVIFKNNTFSGNFANYVSECQIDYKPQPQH
jgi:predicted outer membrane repeat protein